MSKQDELYFRTNVQLKSIIGKDLINDDNIAILELVKNSFDADSKKVDIKFLNIKDNDDKKLDLEIPFTDNTSRIIIEDNGVGMSIKDVRDKWLNIAYSEKKNNFRRYNRIMAGAKGVGRFSCDRLGEYLNLYAKEEFSNDYIQLFIDWKKFEIESDKDLEIQAVPLHYKILTKKDLSKMNIPAIEHGVILEIIKLRTKWAYPRENKSWDVTKLIELKKYLEKLINPNQAFVDNDFGIYMHAPDFTSENLANENSEKFLGKIENTIFEKLDFKATSIESKIIANGTLIHTELKDKGKTIFWIKEKNEFFPTIKNSSIYIYYLNPYAKAFFTKQTGIRSVDYGSIYLFINGFRIPPYGELGDDWLNLEQRRVQGYSRFLSQREIVGRIEITDFQNDFRIISSREGLVKNESFRKLTDQKNSYFFKIFRRLEKYVVEGLRWDSIPEEDQGKIHEIEKKIIAGETNENDLRFREDDGIKNNRIYNSIHSIIAAKPEEVIELYINEELITQKIAEERAQSEKEFEQLIFDIENKKIDPIALERVLHNKALQNKDLEKQIREFSKYNTNEVTSRAILDIQKYKDIIQEQTILIANLQKQLAQLTSEKQIKEKELDIYIDRIYKVNEDLKIEKEKNSYLLATRRTLSKDADGLIHTIKINNIEIRDGIDNIIDDIVSKNYSEKDLIKKLSNIKVNAERSLKLAEIATRSNFNTDIEVRSVDIVKFIIEYIQIYKETFSDDEIEFDFEENDSVLFRSISVLNFSIVLDNLISNSIKWNASAIKLMFKNESKTSLTICFSDNGEGLSKRFLNSPDKIFELSVRDISPKGFGGSGIGLYYTKKLLSEMNADIQFLGNGINLKGAMFQIIFR